MTHRGLTAYHIHKRRGIFSRYYIHLGSAKNCAERSACGWLVWITTTRRGAQRVINKQRRKGEGRS